MITGPPGSTRFAIGSKVVGESTPASSITSWLTVDQNGLVQSLVPSDPGLQVQTSSQPAVIFPATMSTGQSPNNELPPGTTMQTTIKAANAAGEDTKESNILTPTGSDATYLDHCPTDEQMLRCHQKRLFNFHSYNEREELKQYQDTADKLAHLYEEINDLEELYDQS